MHSKETTRHVIKQFQSGFIIICVNIYTVLKTEYNFVKNVNDPNCENNKANLNNEYYQYSLP